MLKISKTGNTNICISKKNTGNVLSGQVKRDRINSKTTPTIKAIILFRLSIK
jgi:hypothetical protein